MSIHYNNIILIPYRQRVKHLDYFIKNTVPLLQKYLPKSKVVIIEQDNMKPFNRGKVLNVGFKEYIEKTNYFITHDVDINPSNKTIIEYYLPNINDNIVKGILTSPCDTLGGIIKISSRNIHKINGFPNDIWGWGTEDKALQNRTEFYNIKKETNFISNKKIRNGEYFKIFDDVDDRQPVNHLKNYTEQYVNFKKYNVIQQQQLIIAYGLNNLEYTILEKKYINNYVELIKVEI